MVIGTTITISTLSHSHKKGQAAYGKLYLPPPKKEKKVLFLIWVDDAGKLFYLPLPTRVGNRAFFYTQIPHITPQLPQAGIGRCEYGYVRIYTDMYRCVLSCNWI